MGQIKRTIEEYAVLTLATLIMVFGIYVFKFPNNFSFGGVTGIAIVLSKFLPGTPGNITLMINIVLLLLGFILLGKGFGIKTAYVSILMSVGLSFTAPAVFALKCNTTRTASPLSGRSLSTPTKVG